MLANDVGLDLAGAAANGGREIVHVGALPKAAFNRVLVSHVCLLYTSDAADE